MNAYITDSKFFLKRASSQLISKPSAKAALVDSLINYAIGMERLFKGILFEINPLFLLETPEFNSAVKLLYRERLIAKHRRVVDSELKKAKNQDARVHAFSTSLHYASHFSETIEKYRGAMTQLCEYRGIVAHRTIAELDAASVWRFMQRTFAPVVTALAAELKQEPASFFHSAARMRTLVILAETIAEAEAFEDQMTKLLETCRKNWAKKKADEAHLMAAADRVRDDLGKDTSHRPRYWTECPACDQKAVLSAEIEGEYEDGEYVTTGIVADGLVCHYCGLTLANYEEVDYFDLYGKLDQARRGRSWH